MSTFSIHTMKPADAETLAALHGAAFEAGWSAEMFRRDLALPTMLVLARLSPEKTPLAFIQLSAVSPDAEIITLAVAPPHRRWGHARALLQAAETKLVRRDIQRLYLEVAEDNSPARALYTKAGFQADGRRVGYYRRHDGQAVDAIIMSRAITGQIRH